MSESEGERFAAVTARAWKWPKGREKGKEGSVL